MTILGIKEFGEDEETGLQKELQILKLKIDGETDEVFVQCRVVLLAPKGGVVKVVSNHTFRRYNRPAIMDGNKEILPANNKFDMLKLSPLGQGILGMLQIDINNIKGFDTIDEDLKQL